MEWIKVAFAQELDDDTVKAVDVAGYRIALYRCEGEFFATDNMCTHAEALLSEGYLEDGCIECPLHQGRFDIRSGKALCAPVTDDLRTHPVKREGDDIYVLSPGDQ
jgi:3-phenylpropionate/trans-cinnamate dioxygenase ferredoxin subunit